MKASLDANTDGNVSGVLECDVRENASFSAWGQWVSKKKNAISMMLGWSGDKFNTRAVFSAKNAHTSSASLTVDNVCRLGNRWTIGHYLKFGGVFNGHPGQSGQRFSFRPNSSPRDYGAAIRYDGHRKTVAASVNKDTEMTVQYRHRVTDALTTGAIMSVNAKHRTSNLTLMYRAALGSGLELRGEARRRIIVYADVLHSPDSLSATGVLIFCRF